MGSVINVAHWFLTKSSMTHKKLQKLCYYAQSWHCALLKRPLFDDEIQAWVHGPVVPSLYSSYAGYKWDDIPQRNETENVFSGDTLEVLEEVYNTYGEFSGDQLESLTHSELPWKSARGDLKPWETSTNTITRKSMQEYYGKLYEAAQND